MKVEMIVGMNGPGLRLKPGDTHEVSAEEGKRLIKAGIAREIKPAPKKRTTRRKKSDS